MHIYTHVKKKGEKSSLNSLSFHLLKNNNFSFSFERNILCDKRSKEVKRTFLSIILHMIVNVISYFKDKSFSLFC